MKRKAPARVVYVSHLFLAGTDHWPGVLGADLSTLDLGYLFLSSAFSQGDIGDGLVGQAPKTGALKRLGPSGFIGHANA